MFFIDLDEFSKTQAVVKLVYMYICMCIADSKVSIFVFQALR